MRWQEKRPLLHPSLSHWWHTFHPIQDGGQWAEWSYSYRDTGGICVHQRLLPVSLLGRILFYFAEHSRGICYWSFWKHCSDPVRWSITHQTKRKLRVVVDQQFLWPGEEGAFLPTLHCWHVRWLRRMTLKVLLKVGNSQPRWISHLDGKRPIDWKSYLTPFPSCLPRN